MAEKTILVVDDSEIARRELINPLQQAGYATAEADSGKQAVEMVRAESFDMIITDVHMPLMNGIEMCEAIRDDETITATPPILVVSTESSPEMKERGKAAGVRGWVIKPVDTEKLVLVAKKLLG